VLGLKSLREVQWKDFDPNKNKYLLQNSYLPSILQGSLAKVLQENLRTNVAVLLFIMAFAN